VVLSLIRLAPANFFHLPPRFYCVILAL